MLDEEKRGTRRKEARGGRRDGEEGGTGESDKIKKSCLEKWKMKKSLKDALLVSLGLVIVNLDRLPSLLVLEWKKISPKIWQHALAILTGSSTTTLPPVAATPPLLPSTDVLWSMNYHHSPATPPLLPSMEYELLRTSLFAQSQRTKASEKERITV